MALNSSEYLKLLQFFTGKLPTLILQVAGVASFGSKIDIKTAYAGVSQKMQILLKSFSANYTRLLNDALTEHNLTHIEHFFVNGNDIARCILPHKTYVKKLATLCARIAATYSRVEKASIILGFNVLQLVVTW
jgi:hypothetical protein